MREQVRLLEELQRHDSRLQEVDAALKALPEKLRALKSDLSKVEALLERERASQAETEKFRRDLEGELKTHEQNIAKAKSKLQQVKTGKDYMAAQREVEATRRIVGEREEELLKLIEAIDGSKVQIEAHERDVAELRGHVAREEAATQEKIDELTGSSAGERAERDAVAKKIRPDLLKKYTTIRQRRGLAVVPVVRGTCQGCHMTIPPQLFNVLQRAGTIETCPQCHRIIYWSELLKDQKLERGENEPA